MKLQIRRSIYFSDPHVPSFPAAFRLRDKLIRDMLFAYRGNPEIYARIQAIDEGNGHADMIQDLSDLSVVGRKYPEQLTALKKFDSGDIGRAGRFSSEMASLLAAAKATTGLTAAKIIRDQAFSYLKTALDEVRAVGRYIFWDRKERLPGYVSQYHRRNRKNAEKNQPVAG